MLSPDETQAMVMLGALESIRSGTTALIEISRNTETFAPALESTGLRLVLAEVMEDLDPEPAKLGIYEYSDDRRGASIQRGSDLVEKWNGSAGGRITCFFAPGAPESCSPQLLRSVREMAESL